MCGGVSHVDVLSPDILGLTATAYKSTHERMLRVLDDVCRRNAQIRGSLQPDGCGLRTIGGGI